MTACAPEKKRASWGRKLLILLAVALLLLWFMQQNLNQVVLSMAYANAQALTVSVLNQAVQEVLATGVSYDDMMIVQKDDAGRVSLLQANTTLMNSLASETALHAQAALSSLENQLRAVGFLRCNVEYLVNARYITLITSSSIFLTFAFSSSFD